MIRSQFAWFVSAVRLWKKKSQVEVAAAARLLLAEYIAIEASRWVPRMWQGLLLADALSVSRDWLCRLAAQEKEEEEVHDEARRAVSAG